MHVVGSCLWCTSAIESLSLFLSLLLCVSMCISLYVYINVYVYVCVRCGCVSNTIYIYILWHVAPFWYTEYSIGDARCHTETGEDVQSGLEVNGLTVSFVSTLITPFQSFYHFFNSANLPKSFYIKEEGLQGRRGVVSLVLLMRDGLVRIIGLYCYAQSSYGNCLLGIETSVYIYRSMSSVKERFQIRPWILVCWESRLKWRVFLTYEHVVPAFDHETRERIIYNSI